MVFPDRSYFFDAGIRFACRRCGRCCTGAPGLVRVDAPGVAAIAAFLRIPVAECVRRYAQQLDAGYRLLEHADGRCVFFDSGCRIYPVRPLQCRTFPFWLANMRSRERWDRIARGCPGIGHGPCVDRETIIERVVSGLSG